MHLIVITSVIRPQNAPTIFSAEERYRQLIDSIKSVRGKIPDCLIIVLEGSSYTDDQIKSVMESRPGHFSLAPRLLLVCCW